MSSDAQLPFCRPTNSAKGSSLPPTLLGRWAQGNRLIEIRANDFLYSVDEGAPYTLSSNGTVLQTGRSRPTFYDRVYGDPAGLLGVWDYRTDPNDPYDESELFTFHQNGLYSSQSPSGIYYGEFTYDAATMSTIEGRGLLSESGGILTLDPPYGADFSGPWSVVNDVLTWVINGVPSVWTRVL